MAEPQVFGFCNQNCKHPVYTQTQVLSILQQAIDAGSLAGINPDDSPIVALIREQHENSNLAFWIGSEAEFNALSPKPTTALVMGRLDSNGKLYFCTDDSTLTDWQTQTVQMAAAEASEAVSGVVAQVNQIVASKQNQHIAKTVTLSASGWSGTTLMQTVSAAGVTANNTVFIAPAVASYENYTAAGIVCTAQGAGTLTFKCKTLPDSSISVNIAILGV